jgi:hypothetical protein
MALREYSVEEPGVADGAAVCGGRMNSCQSIQGAVQALGRICMEVGLGSHGTAMKLETLVVEEAVMERLGDDIGLGGKSLGETAGFH